MKRVAIFCGVLAALVFTTGTVGAQELGIMKAGEMIKPDGTRAYFVSSTTVVVDLTVVRETVKIGPYARFAQKYFGVIAPLADKDTYSLLSAELGYVDPMNSRSNTLGELPAKQVQRVVPTDMSEDFPRVLPDKLSSAGRSAEESAAAAAQTIFELRKRRADLVTGEYAETVYGAGLQAAIDRIDKMENEYLELFFGKQTKTTYTVRYKVTPSSKDNTFVVCRFRDDSGLIPVNDLTAEPVMLDCRPTNIASSVYPYDEKRKPGKGEAIYAVADMVNCRVMFGKRELGNAQLPMYQYGVSTVLPVK